MKKYMNAIKRKLNMPKDVKERVMNDLLSSVTARREAGLTDEEIMVELGTPKKAAAELNEQMKEFTYQKSPWRWACLALCIGCGASLLLGGWSGIVTYLFNHSAGVIGGADGPTAIFITTAQDPGAQQQQLMLRILLLAMGLIGFVCLSRLKKKQ